MGSIFKPKKGPSQEELQAAQEAAAQRERERLKAESDQKAVADLEAQESKRRAFAGQLANEDDKEQRRKFLKGA